MLIRDVEVDVDVYEELSNYSWSHAKRKGNEFIACSPFRNEQHPSFYVNMETGMWIDFGSDDTYWKKGNFVKLYSYLENISYEEAEEALLQSYGYDFDYDDDLELNINIQEEPEPKTFSREELRPYLFRNRGYLLNRGISDEIMKKFVIGYDKERHAVVFFWQDAFTGKVVNVKFRSIRGKQFYYIQGGQPVRNHIFGLYHVVKDNCKRVIIVESEIDALYLWTLGFPAVAIGGSYLSDRQKRLLMRSGIEEIIIGTDNDKVGRRIRESLIKELGGSFLIKDLKIPSYAKDVNEVAPDVLVDCVLKADFPKLNFL